ncbi:MAG: 3-hydroxyacyl-CoA dehydrogenase NAD-binding domain-containing protein [Melioribacteraceae bacterium]|nr:FAD-dependent oxidoreductase [Melioribacteraceae bacterium]MDD3558214.1 3-hydroxyacyl-CoA dehydrogenase NAD-binding domain-containing protein [Melioribacteraceae bacterium]
MIDKRKYKIAVVGAGTMGTGIAQVAASAGHEVTLVDTNKEALEGAEENLKKILTRLSEKGKINIEDAHLIFERIDFKNDLNTNDYSIVIEAIVENLVIKKKLFSNLEAKLNNETIFATNTSSLSITAIASACQKPERVIGTHFFNPAPLLPLVEIVPGLTTNKEIIQKTKSLLDAWGKTTVIAKDTPGFIVNRVARPFYGEALRIYEEGIANVATIDWAMKELGGFKMGPFELMDLIGNDVNYEVTKTVFEQFYYDPRFKPSLAQKQLVEAKHFGRKSGKGFYDYSDNAENPMPNKDEKLGREILDRILAMLINEAADAVFMNIASVEDIDLAMTKGVNYPKGLCKWSDEIGVDKIVERLESLYKTYGEDRYRINPILRKMKKEGSKFYE